MPVHLYAIPLTSIRSWRFVANINCRWSRTPPRRTARNTRAKSSVRSRNSCFSFYPGKNLGACGEGGALVTNNPAFDKRGPCFARTRLHRALYSRRSRIQLPDGRFQGAVLGVKLKHLVKWTAERRRVAMRCDGFWRTNAADESDARRTPACTEDDLHATRVRARAEYPVVCAHSGRLATSQPSATNRRLPHRRKAALRMSQLPEYLNLNDTQIQRVARHQDFSKGLTCRSPTGATPRTDEPSPEKMGADGSACGPEFKTACLPEVRGSDGQRGGVPPSISPDVSAHAEHRALKTFHPVIVSDFVVIITHGGSRVPRKARARLSKAGLFVTQRAAFAAGAKILARIKTEQEISPNVPTIIALVFRAVRLAGSSTSGNLCCDKSPDRDRCQRMGVKMHGR